jgi:hypothetical protein
MSTATDFIVLQFSRPDPDSQDLKSRIISAGICEDSHAEICHVDLEVDGKLIGAHMPDGIQERSPDYQTWGLRIRVIVPVTSLQKMRFDSYALSMIGTPYDLESIFSIALNDGRLHDASKLICSAFGTRAVDHTSGIVRVAKNYWMVSPEELRLVVTAIPGAIEQRVEGNGPIPEPQVEAQHA